MKKITIPIFLITILFSNLAYSIDPTYELRVKNFTYIADNILEFDIFLKHTNPSQTTFEYSMGQYVLTCVPYFGYPGTLTYSISPNLPCSDLPANQIPINPAIAGNELRLASNVPKSPGSGYIISSTGDGTKIIRMRLQTTSNSFYGHIRWLNLTWKNSTGLYTKIASSDSDENLIYNITNPTYHFVNDASVNTITGSVFVDFNNNGAKDFGEPHYLQAHLVLNNVLGILPQTGIYSMPANLGQYNVRMSPIPPGFTANPLIRTVNFTSEGQISENNDFALSITSNRQDLQIFIVPVYKPRPGFQSVYDIYFENLGTTNIITGKVSLVYEKGRHGIHYEYQSSVPLPASVTYYFGTRVDWIYSNLNPGERRVIRVNFLTPTSIPLGDHSIMVGTIFPTNPEDYVLNNYFRLEQIVVGSFDPNDKNVSPSGIITQDEVINENRLKYTVRFQNTGTDTAFTVRILDTLSQNLNTDSLQIVGASHEFSYRIIDNIIEWTFDNILLPDSTTNEPESHGFIVYSVKPKNTLVVGDEIKNTAYIYFDFNEPVVTNTVVTPIGIRKNYLDLSWRLEAMYPVKDTVKVYLRSPVSPYSLVDSAKVYADLASQNYNSKIEFIDLEYGSEYYIVVKHRNSIETWSASPIVFFTDTTVYNFTDSLGQAFGSNMILDDNVASFYSGDVNQDGNVEAQDLGAIDNDAFNFATGYRNSDLTGNNNTDAADLAIADNNAFNFVSKVTPP